MKVFLRHYLGCTLSVLHLGLSAIPFVLSGCAGRPSPTVPVLCHGPVRWSPEMREDWRRDCMKKHRDACEKRMMEKSAVAEHVWENHLTGPRQYPPNDVYPQ